MRSPYGRCLSCERPWHGFRRAQPHDTTFIDVAPGVVGRGMLPLCERCWQALTIEERLPFYRQLWGLWLANAREPDYVAQLEERWPLIEAAVRAGR